MGKGLIPGLEREVHVVRHEAEGVYPITETLDPCGDELVEVLPVRRGEEDVLAGVTAQDHMIETPRHVQARFASHAGSIVNWRSICN